MITNHTQLINALIEKHNLTDYCEIGINNPDANFNHIRCKNKTGVDPDPNAKAEGVFTLTSDQYFSHIPEFINHDIYFIDGLHTKEQVKKDFENALSRLSDNGFIVIHDVLPENEAGTLVPRIQKQWWGDVFSFAMNMNTYNGLNFATMDFDNGCMIVWKLRDGTVLPQTNYTYKEYLEFGRSLMQVTTWDKFNEVVI